MLYARLNACRLAQQSQSIHVFICKMMYVPNVTNDNSTHNSNQGRQKKSQNSEAI